MTTPNPFPQAVARELRAEMARQQKTVSELATALGLRDRKSARLRYEGVKPMTLEEVVRAAIWLGIDRNQLLSATEAVAS